jgi:16S rRNA C967 or C1407 C5-methylase (RsmB/RsmF family)/NOL1/NOP2/fmu family ribosome biogenesis protein
MSILSKLPQDFIQSMRLILNEDVNSFLNALEAESPVSIRFNPQKINPSFDNKSSIPWAKLGYYLPERPSFTLDPHFHAGAYYVQEASSMFIEQFVLQYQLDAKPLMVLDLCAAPGGKTSHLASLLHADSLIVANEILKSRYEVLKANVIKEGFDNIVVFNLSPEALANKYQDFFDLILVDAPCSGEGMFRKDPDSISHWTADAVNNCSVRQASILQLTNQMLKPNGHLIYSTCTYNHKENDLQIIGLNEKYGYQIKKIELSQNSAVKESSYGYHFFPHLINGEGFFCSLLQKEDAHYQSPYFKKTKWSTPNTVAFEKYLLDPFQFVFHTNKENEVYAIPKRLEDSFLKLGVDIRFSTWHIGQMMRHDFNPAHDLIMKAKWLNFANINSITVDKFKALQYLKGDTFGIESEPGIHAIMYEQQAIGWIKSLGTRFNNQYPKHYRIKMDIPRNIQ